ncbi:MAG TPA: hypothetical protein VFR79_01840 [Nitrospira sp.]|nr:hypothetical protein [Nitrospira sp.]
MSEMWQEAMVAAFRETMSRGVLFLPKLMAMVTFLLVGLVMGWLVKLLLMRILHVVRFEVFCERMGLTPAFAKAGMKQRIPDLIGRLSFWIVFLFFAFMGVDALDLPATANLMSAILAFLPNVIAAVLVGLLGILLANFSGEAVLIAAVNAQLQGARFMANMVRWGVNIFTAAMVLTQLGIAKEIVVAAFSIIFGGIVLAMAIAVGLGGRTIAKEALERRLRREKTDDEFTHI